ncbi:MAG: hypothetical protein Q4D32_03685 [Eubacteriales bacterium]|nr:hypothetical protein [Eubacteriales bacterium]
MRFSDSWWRDRHRIRDPHKKQGGTADIPSLTDLYQGVGGCTT